ncbi:MAG: glycosyltransferase 87 family protein [Candidatus Omnitrophica bacterium]|nr:glycosyltransferase 87 family protein [Candidatus Omnitrophota bacterium]
MTRFPFVAIIKIIVCIIVIVFFFLRLYKEKKIKRDSRTAKSHPAKLAFLILVAILSVGSYFNFFQFHLNRANRSHFINYNEFIIHYLGSKYFDELGYFNLYNAIVVADAETSNVLADDQKVRDLKSYRYISKKDILSNSAYYKSLFSSSRWHQFTSDITALVRQCGSGLILEMVLVDHGYHTTPVWNTTASILSNYIPVDRIIFLALLDVFLLVLMFYAVSVSFGIEVMLIGLIYFSVNYISSFSWIGGAFLRYDWFVALVLALCMINSKRYAWAGVCISYAAMVRIFPVLFLAGPLVKGIDKICRKKKFPDEYKRFFAAFVITSLILFGYSCIHAKCPQRWLDFKEKITFQNETLLANNVGFKVILLSDRTWSDIDSFMGKYGKPGEDAFNSMNDVKREEIHARSREFMLYAICFLVLFFLLVRTKDDTESLAWGIFLMFTLLMPLSYYYIVLMMLVLIFYKRPITPGNTSYLTIIFLIQIISFLLSSKLTFLMPFFIVSFMLFGYLLYLAIVEIYKDSRLENSAKINTVP